MVAAGILLAVGARAAPSITNVNAPTSVGKYNCFESAFNVSTAATNMFWPYDTNTPTSITPGQGVSVDGLFSNDNWATTTTVPAFYCQDYTRTQLRAGGFNYEDEAVQPVGTPNWRLRFAPQQTGTWHYRIRVTDASGTTTYPASGDLTFDCTQSTSHGFVRVSPKDYRYFELSDGTPLQGCGVDTLVHNTYEADSLFSTYGNNGVKIARYMINFWNWQNPFGGGDYAGNGGGPWWSYKLVLSHLGGCKPGDRYSAEVDPGKDVNQTVYLAAGAKYRFTGHINATGITSSGGGVPYIAGLSGSTAGGSSGWVTFSLDYTPNTSGNYFVGVRHTGTNGVVLFDDVSLKASTDGGATWSGECLSKGDFSFEKYVDMKEAWKVDRVLDAAQKNGVYLKMVLSDKLDQTLGCINPDGGTGSFSYANVYAAANTPNLWLWKSWWRYCAARWGAYTAIHSWEVLSEGDPFDGNFYNFSNTFSDYMHNTDPEKHLTSTSFWTNIPMEFWKTSSCDYLDVHEYFGTQGYNGPRCYAWMDNVGNPLSSPAGCLAAVNNGTANYGELYYDVGRGGTGRSIKQVTKAGYNGGGDDCVAPMSEYHIGMDPSHTYTLRYWAKASGVGSTRGWTRPGIRIYWSKAYHANDFVGYNDYTTNLGTYDWTKYENASVQSPAGANTANIQVIVPSDPSVTSNFWVDDVELIDNITGQNIFSDGGFEGDRIDFDTALATRKYAVLLDSYSRRMGKPAMWAETGVNGVNMNGNTSKPNDYQGYSYTDEYQLLVNDTNGIHMKKLIWAHIGPENPYMLYWWQDNLTKKNLWHYFGAYQAFMANIPISNGNYKDAKATTSSAKLRAWGQKDPVNNKAHLWIDNSAYTWKNVVDGVSIPTASGTVTIPGLMDGPYVAEWWDTSTGTVTSQQDVSSSGGILNLQIQSLQSDTACKIYPKASVTPTGPSIALSMTASSPSVPPGGVITYTINFTNTGDVNATGVVLSAIIPSLTSYVSGSAEANGGTFNATSGTVNWNIGTIAARASGSKTYQVKIK